MNRSLSHRDPKMYDSEQTSGSTEMHRASHPKRLFQSSMKAVRNRIRQHAVQTGDWPPPNAIFGSKQVHHSTPSTSDSSRFCQTKSQPVVQTSVRKAEPKEEIQAQKLFKSKTTKSNSKKKPNNLHAMIANFREGPSPDQSKLPVLIESADGGFICPGTDMNTIIEGFMEFERYFKRGGLLPFANVMPISTGSKSKSNSLDLEEYCPETDNRISEEDEDEDNPATPLQTVQKLSDSDKISDLDMTSPPTSIKMSSLKDTSSCVVSSPAKRTGLTKKQVTFDHDSFPHKKKGGRIREHPLQRENNIQDTVGEFVPLSEANDSPVSESTFLIATEASCDPSVKEELGENSKIIINESVSDCSDEKNNSLDPSEDVILEADDPPNADPLNQDKIKGDSLDPNEIGDAIQKCLENLRLASDSYGALMMGGDKDISSKKNRRVQISDSQSQEPESRGLWRRLMCLRSHKREPYPKV